MFSCQGRKYCLEFLGYILVLFIEMSKNIVLLRRVNVFRLYIENNQLVIFMVMSKKIFGAQGGAQGQCFPTLHRE